MMQQQQSRHSSSSGSRQQSMLRSSTMKSSSAAQQASPLSSPPRLDSSAAATSATTATPPLLMQQQQFRAQPPAQVFTRGTTGSVKTSVLQALPPAAQVPSQQSLPSIPQQQPLQQRRRSRSHTRNLKTAASNASNTNNTLPTVATATTSSSGTSSNTDTSSRRYRRSSSAQPTPLRLQHRTTSGSYSYHYSHHHQHQYSPSSASVSASSSSTSLQQHQQQQHFYSAVPSASRSMTSSSVDSNTLAATAPSGITRNSSLPQTMERSFHRGDSCVSDGVADREGSVRSTPSVSSSSGRGGTRGYGGGGGGFGVFSNNNNNMLREPSPLSCNNIHNNNNHNSPQRSVESDKKHAKTCRRVLDDLSRAQGLERRIAALTHVCECFDHDDEFRHNMELQLGAVPVLIKCLQVTAYNHDDDEIRMILSALEMVWRGSPRDVQLAYSKLMIGAVGVGSSASTTTSSGSGNSSTASPSTMASSAALFPSNHYLVLHHLFRILERCELTNTMKHAEVSILNITKIVFYLSRGPPDFRVALCQKPGVLESLRRVGMTALPGTSTGGGEPIMMISSSSSNISQSVNNYLADVRFYRMRTIANLANVDENKVLMLNYNNNNKEERNADAPSPSLAAASSSTTSSSSYTTTTTASSLTLLESILRVAHWDPDDMTRQYAASALMDLASSPKNQVTMANDDKVLGTLVKMTLVEKNSLTREFVITALQNLAFCKENRSRLVLFRDGVLLEALKQALASDLDAKARRRAAGALTNLVCEETAERMGHQKGLLDTLAIVATKDDNWDVQTRASLALTKIANCITVQMECHGVLLDALVVASLSKASNSVSAVLRIKARNPDNRETMARHPGVIDTLTDICVSGTAKVNDRDNAIRSLMHLVNESKNQKLLCNKTVLDALVAGASYTDPDLEEARDSAIRALERLATETTNRDVMARHPGLLTAVAQAVERESNWQDEGRESEHGYLAKPLLMSLLVAM